MTELVYTLTAGRTGTAWLAKLFAANVDCIAHHEFMGFGQFGILSQDVGLMGAFNHWGNRERVQSFWQRKFSLIPDCSLYVETNHALAKCGLIENLSMLPDDAAVSIIVLQRDWLAQASSYIARHDFANYSTVWLWYLDARYQNVIVSAEPFANLGTLGHIAWYIAEMEARQAYYPLLYGDRYRFVGARLEEMTTHAGAQRLLGHFGHSGPVELPARTNANTSQIDAETEEQLRALLDRISFDAVALAQTYINAGRRLDVRFEG